MSTSPVSAGSAPPISEPVPPKISTDQAVPRQGARWQNYITTILVVLLALAVLVTITRNWNAWEGGKVEQVTDDAYVRGDLTPLSTKVSGIVRSVDVADYQQVHKGDLVVELQASACNRSRFAFFFLKNPISGCIPVTRHVK